MLYEKGMRMKKYEKRLVETNELVEVTCDICGKSCKSDCDFEYSSLIADWGFGSKHDGELWHYHFCMDCSEKLLVRINELRGSL